MCFHKSKFFHLRVDLVTVHRNVFYREAAIKSGNLFPFEKNIVDVSMHLKPSTRKRRLEVILIYRYFIGLRVSLKKVFR